MKKKTRLQLENLKYLKNRLEEDVRLAKSGGEPLLSMRLNTVTGEVENIIRQLEVADVFD